MSEQVQAKKDEAESPQAEITPFTEATIAERAYALFMARGWEHGRDIEDWLQAERELREELLNVAEDPLDGQASS